MSSRERPCVKRLRAAVERVTAELGPWAALYWVTEFLREPLKEQAKADTPPKQPRGAK